MHELDLEVNQNINEGKISFKCEIPQNLQKAMSNFIEERPNWDQYNIIEAALAEFLRNKGTQSSYLMKLLKQITHERLKSNNNL